LYVKKEVLTGRKTRSKKRKNLLENKGCGYAQDREIVKARKRKSPIIKRYEEWDRRQLLDQTVSSTKPRRKKERGAEGKESAFYREKSTKERSKGTCLDQNRRAGRGVTPCKKKKINFRKVWGWEEVAVHARHGGGEGEGNTDAKKVLHLLEEPLAKGGGGGEKTPKETWSLRHTLEERVKRRTAENRRSHLLGKKEVPRVRGGKGNGGRGEGDGVPPWNGGAQDVTGNLSILPSIKGKNLSMKKKKEKKSVAVGTSKVSPTGALRHRKRKRMDDFKKESHP